jgi:cellulose synthase (UDP-forming)
MTRTPFSLPIGKVSAMLLYINIIVALLYFSWWFHPSHIGNPILYGLLFFGEAYHVFMALLFWLTVWPRKTTQGTPQASDMTIPVDIFIPVTGEPVDVVRETVLADKAIEYPNKKIFILNDGYVAHKDNWEEIEELARQANVVCITRRTPGGAKAGNINNALRQTSGEIVVIFDADMVAHPSFLQRTIPSFKDPKIGFVQTPQFYKNASLNEVTGGAWEQQEFFFGPIMHGKNSVNAAFICGTNVAIRRSALEQVGGMEEANIAEDFLTSLAIHQRGWRSQYLTTVLAQGLAPVDLLAYYKQQLRWARGSLEVLFGQNPLIKGGLTLSQKLQYLSSALYYFNGFIVLIDSLMPLVFLLFGLQPVAATTTSFALFFIPFMFLNLYTLFLVSNQHMTYRAISFSMASFTLQLSALFSVLTKRKMAFAVTPKKGQSGSFHYLVYPHLVYIGLVVAALIVGINREGMTPSMITNAAWALFNALLFLPFIRAAFQPENKQQIAPTSDYSYKKTIAHV